MRVVRGGRADPEADRRLTETLLSKAIERDQSALRIWAPPRHVAFGRRDSTREGYPAALQLARRAGYPSIQRTVGGHAVVCTGRTVAFTRILPGETSTSGIRGRYDETLSRLERALGELGVDVSRGEPDGAFCPGTCSLSAQGKIVGLAQRVRHEGTLVAGLILVDDHQTVGTVLEPVYDALSLPFDPDAVGSIARAGGEADHDRVTASLEKHLVASPSEVDRQSAAEVRDT